MKITFVIGGARSGKSSFALGLATAIEGTKAFVATAEALDDEMKDRIDKHRIERGSEWMTYEEPINLSQVLHSIKDEYPVIIIDCLTIWLSNILIKTQIAESGPEAAKEDIRKFTDDLRSLSSSEGPVLFLISNEVGMGIVPENRLARQFRDLAGMLNRKVAEIADEVYMVTAGIPQKIKDKK